MAENKGSRGVPEEDAAHGGVGPMSDASRDPGRHVDDAMEARRGAGHNLDANDPRRRGAGSGEDKDRQKAFESAIEREASGTQVHDYYAPAARRNVGPTGVPLIWVASNRTDNRAVGFWLDENQPGGQVFLGPGVELVAKTADIDALLMQGLIVQVPEPKRWMTNDDGEHLMDPYGRRVPHPKYPAQKIVDPTLAMASQPGRATPLGRNFDPDMFDEDGHKEIRERQARLPREVGAPVGGIVPGVTHPIT